MVFRKSFKMLPLLPFGTIIYSMRARLTNPEPSNFITDRCPERERSSIPLFFLGTAFNILKLQNIATVDISQSALAARLPVFADFVAYSTAYKIFVAN
jgi:hypothetical protein